MLRVANYDSKALEVLYDRYSPLLYTLIKKIVEKKVLAEEVLIEVFAIIWRKIELYDSEKNNAFTWLVSIARNKAVDVVRRKKGGAGNINYSEEFENRFIIPRLSQTIDPLDLNTASSISGNVETALNNLTDAEVIDAFLMLTRTEGIIPALESSHAVAEAIKVARKSKKSESIVVTLSGRGDKDVEEVQKYLEKHDKD